ncbi:hypothetical protein [Azotobacter beijerinckii]|uniref:Uncharacterized protein n=1 Tax=Azotobacter beijerinckii TaxID=170623 RepID=A0A1I4JLS4_9GAMM|nr:hypothetical protein [Azotobacter beijerinckii]SFB65674.1 hypothetical protein SAMN04244571_04867 [Azotobacter beijerinckii]SFL67538.1 hypothetical protein SAMN04244574_04857 [Azotobacter beijerinckii]
MKTYYSTTTFLTLSINRHLYEGKHYVYVAEGFYPYGKRNPKSSNPLLIYMDLYQPWKNRDKHDKFVLQHRLAVRKGILAKEKDGMVPGLIAQDLRRVADRIRLEFFYPVVYRIKFDVSAAGGRGGVTVAGSGRKGSSEFLIHNLEESDYELLFNDNYTHHFDKLREPPGYFASKVDAVDALLAWSS